jgi:hypothetical protein
MNKPVLQDKVILRVSKLIGETMTGTQMVALFNDAGVPSAMIDYPNTKWVTAQGVLKGLSDSNNPSAKGVLHKVLTEFSHPLRYDDEKKADEIVKKLNQVLKFDHIQVEKASSGEPYVDDRSEQRSDADWEIYFDKQYGETVEELSKTKTKEIATLKTAYSLMVDITRWFINSKFEPDEKMNDMYLKVSEIAIDAHNDIFNKLNDGLMRAMGFPTDEFYLPFSNLYAACEKMFDSPFLAQEIIRKMRKYQGEIIDLHHQCDVGNQPGDKSTQQILDEVANILSGTDLTGNKPRQNVVIDWPDIFQWSKDEKYYIFDEANKLEFSGEDSDRKTIFKMIVDGQGDWVKLANIEKVIGKDKATIRSVINQIQNEKIIEKGLLKFLRLEPQGHTQKASAYRAVPYPTA